LRVRDLTERIRQGVRSTATRNEKHLVELLTQGLQTDFAGARSHRKKLVERPLNELCVPRQVEAHFVWGWLVSDLDKAQTADATVKSLPGKRAGLSAADRVMPLLPPTGWLGRALSSDSPFVAAADLLVDWPD
jgi:hypothetical protein